MLNKVENIVTKGEIAQFNLWPQCFQKSSVAIASESETVFGKGLTNHFEIENILIVKSDSQMTFENFVAKGDNEQLLYLPPTFNYFT